MEHAYIQCENVNMAPIKKQKLPLGKTFIAEWREASGLTQESLAEKIQMSRSALSKMETADAPYTQRTLEAIARALNCKPYDLLLRAPTDNSSRGYLISLLMTLSEAQLNYARGALETAASVMEEKS